MMFKDLNHMSYMSWVGACTYGIFYLFVCMYICVNAKGKTVINVKECKNFLRIQNMKDAMFC